MAVEVMLLLKDFPTNVAFDRFIGGGHRRVRRGEAAFFVVLVPSRREADGVQTLDVGFSLAEVGFLTQRLGEVEVLLLQDELLHLLAAARLLLLFLLFNLQQLGLIFFNLLLVRSSRRFWFVQLLFNLCTPRLLLWRFCFLLVLIQAGIFWFLLAVWMMGRPAFLLVPLETWRFWFPRVFTGALVCLNPILTMETMIWALCREN